MRWHERQSLVTALGLHFAAIFVCTLIGASLDDWHWDTISAMITRGDGRLAKAFAVVLVLCTAVQCALVFALKPAHWVWVPTGIAVVAQIAFGIVSVDEDVEWHERLATLAFGSLWVVVTALAWQKDRLGLGVPFAAAAALLFLVDGAFYYEYALVVGIHWIFYQLLQCIPRTECLVVQVSAVPEGFVEQGHRGT